MHKIEDIGNVVLVSLSKAIILPEKTSLYINNRGPETVTVFDKDGKEIIKLQPFHMVKLKAIWTIDEAN